MGAAHITLYLMWRPSDLFTGPHGQASPVFFSETNEGKEPRGTSWSETWKSSGCWNRDAFVLITVILTQYSTLVPIDWLRSDIPSVIVMTFNPLTWVTWVFPMCVFSAADWCGWHANTVPGCFKPFLHSDTTRLWHAEASSVGHCWCHQSMCSLCVSH